MPLRTDTFDLGALRLTHRRGSPARAARRARPVTCSAASATPSTPELVPVRLDISRTTGDGYALRLRFEATLAGPCMRCLEPAAPEFAVDAREVSQPGETDELASPYVERGVLDLRCLGARRARAGAAGDAPVPAGLRRAVPGLRRRPQRRRCPSTTTSASRIRAGRSCPSCGSSNSGSPRESPPGRFSQGITK